MITIAPYDPKLKECAKEISKILESYDVVGSMVLISESHSEFKIHLGASWSVAHFENGNIRFRARLQDFKTKEQQHKCITGTVHAFDSIRCLSAVISKNMASIIEQLKKFMEIESDLDKQEPYSGGSDL